MEHSIRDRIGAGIRAFRDPSRVGEGGVSPVGVNRIDTQALPPRLRYAVLESYFANDAYQKLRSVIEEGFDIPDDFDRIRGLENPALQAVTFHVAHVFPGPLDEALPLADGTPDGLIAAWDAICRWGGMAFLKDALVEGTAMRGDTFLKSATSADGAQVYPELFHPGDVSYFQEDNRRAIRAIRIDRELPEDQHDEATHYTEVWDRTGSLVEEIGLPPGTFVAWRHRLGDEAALSELPDPVEGTPALITTFGHDFVPFVRVPFSGGAQPNTRSLGVYEPHLEPIDRMLRHATDLNHLYRENAEGAWVATPNAPGAAPLTFRHSDPESEAATEEVHYGRRIVKMPGMADVHDLVAGIDYDSGLNIEDKRRAMLERSLQELRYSRGNEGGDPSAAAIRQDQAPAIQRSAALRGNSEDGLLNVARMCFSIMIARRIAPPGIGTFDSGAWDDLAFARRPILPETTTERYERESARADVWEKHSRMGTLRWYLINHESFTEEQADEVVAQSRTNATRAGIEDIIGGRV